LRYALYLYSLGVQLLLNYSFYLSIQAHQFCCQILHSCCLLFYCFLLSASTPWPKTSHRNSVHLTLFLLASDLPPSFHPWLYLECYLCIGWQVFMQLLHSLELSECFF
jgi:hypothetical protein